jgi:large subunit ribosomal protein L4
MPTIDVYNIAGKKVGRTELPKEIFNVRVNPKVVAQSVRSFLSNQRRAKAKTKTRGEVSGSGRKIWRQKGTGRARHGDRYAPIFVGGGRAHGPTGEQNYLRKLSKKMKKVALFNALTSKYKSKDITIIGGLAKIAAKTKEFEQFLVALNIWPREVSRPSVLVVLPTKIEPVIRAARNLEKVDLVQANCLSSYQVLAHQKLVFMKESLEKLKENFLKS